jgi:uncharacterized repeat protein (TIGR01451 family)
MPRKAKQLALIPFLVGLWVVLLAILLVLPSAAAPAQGHLMDDQPDGSTIAPSQTVDGTWGPGTITATTDVDIQSGVIITIAPGTTIQISTTDNLNAGLDATRIEFLVQSGAELRVNGPVTFTSQSDMPFPGAWYGIQFLDGSSGWVDGATIQYGVHALTLDTTNPVTVTNSRLRANYHLPVANSLAYGGGLYIVQGDHRIQNVDIYGNTAWASGSGEARGGGIYIQGGSPHILNSRIYENVVYCERNCAGAGIGVLSGGAQIESSHVTSNVLSGTGEGYLKTGAGIGFVSDTSAVISDCLIAANQNTPAAGYAGGGGIGFDGDATASLIWGNVIYNNYASGPGWSEGGGVDTWAVGDSVVVANNLILSNTLGSVGGIGGGMNMNGNATGTYVVNNTIAGNQAVEGGGLYLQNGTVNATNNIIAYNSATTSGGGVRQFAGTVDYNDVFGNTAPSGPDTSGPVGPNNINADPLFLSTGGLVQWYHIQHGSPAIDAGTGTGSGVPVDDFDHQLRPLGLGWDMGFDEVSPLTYTKYVNPLVASGAYELAYTVIVTNVDPIAIGVGGQITDALPLNTALAAGPTCDLGACGFDGSNIITWTGDIPPSSALTLGFTATVDAGLSDGHEITNSARIDFGVLANTTNVVTTTVYNPVFTLTKSVAGTPVAGVPFSYTILVSNTSVLVGATNVLVTDTVPAGASYVSGGQHAGGIVTWTVPTIAADQSASVSFSISACQTTTNTTYRVADSDQGVGSGWGPILVTQLAEPTIAPAFTVDPSVVMLGEQALFTDTSTTNGSSIAEWGWDFGDGESGTGATTSHTYDATGSYTVTLRVTDTCGFAHSAASPGAVLVAVPEIEVLPLTLQASLAANATTTRTLTISNIGLVDLTWLMAEAPDVPWLWLPTGTAVLPGITAPEDSSAVDVSFDSSELADDVYTTTLSIESNDPAMPLVTVGVTLTVKTPVYGVQVTAEQSALSGNPGHVVSYTLTVQNLGNVDDRFDVELTGEDWLTSASPTTVGPLAQGATGTLRVNVYIPPSAQDGASDTVSVNLTSRGEISASDSVSLTTTAIIQQTRLYLPFVIRTYGSVH